MMCSTVKTDAEYRILKIKIQKGPEGQFFHSEGGECLERAARDSRRGGFNVVF